MSIICSTSCLVPNAVGAEYLKLYSLNKKNFNISSTMWSQNHNTRLTRKIDKKTCYLVHLD